MARHYSDGLIESRERSRPIVRLSGTTTAAARHRSGVHELLDRPWRHRPLAACLLLVSRSSWRLACANSSTPSTCPNPIRAGTRRPAPRWCPVGPTSRGICVGCARLDLRRDGWCVLATSMMSSRSLLSPPLLPSPPLPSPPIRALGRGRDRRRADGAGRAVGECGSVGGGYGELQPARFELALEVGHCRPIVVRRSDGIAPPSVVPRSSLLMTHSASGAPGMSGEAKGA